MRVGRFIAESTVLLLTLVASASAAETRSCTESAVTLNQVTAMRSFANGSIKLFAIDQEEPAAAPAGVAVTIDRGDSLADAESFCRYVGGLSSVDVLKARPHFDAAKNILVVEMPARKSAGDGERFVDTTLKLTIDKAAKAEAGLVRAEVR